MGISADVRAENGSVTASVAGGRTITAWPRQAGCRPQRAGDIPPVQPVPVALEMDPGDFTNRVPPFLVDSPAERYRLAVTIAESALCGHLSDINVRGYNGRQIQPMVPCLIDICPHLHVGSPPPSSNRPSENEATIDGKVAINCTKKQ
jgi:hypothetical protein